jgi:hypothetical protein
MSEEQEDCVRFKTITVSQILDKDGEVHIEVDDDGDLYPWEKIGMLTVALEWAKAESFPEDDLWDDE